jgi:FkbM family methyltransferase
MARGLSPGGSVRDMSSRSLGAVARRLFGRSKAKRDRRDRLNGVLQQLQVLSFAPATIIDVGAAYGDFARACHAVFTNARYVLIEPLAEYGPSLETALQSLPGAEIVRAAAASTPGEITLNVHGDLVGSSLYLEQEDSAVNGVPRRVPAITLDGLRAERGLKSPFLIKIDVQGAELDVLAGATEMLREAEYVVLEVSFFEFFRGGPLFHDVVAFMAARGFVAYDIFGFQYRPLDGALSQADVAFVRETGPFREHHFYATREQRERQDRSLRQHAARARAKAE